MTLTHQHGDRVWTESGRVPHIRRDGSLTELITWSTPCAHPGCTDLALCTTPATGFEVSKAFGAKHCSAHKLTPEQVLERINATRRRKHA
jgi:hypothetical protein